MALFATFDLKILDKYEISSRQENLVKVGARLVVDGEASAGKFHVNVDFDVLVNGVTSAR